MRYIRTAVDVEIVISEFEKDLIVRPKDEKYYPNHRLDKKFVLKQADTIPELCDVFVDTSELKTTNTGGWLYDEFDTKNKCLVYYEHDERKTISLNEFDDLSKIYGAIWTDKGLIYTAKIKCILPNGEIDWKLL